MKTITLLALLAFSTTSFAAETLLRCNIPWGELQEVVIKREGTVYILQQLNNVGSIRTYPMTAKQWEKKKINLKLSFGEKGTLSLTDTGWIYRSPSEYYVVSCSTR